VAAVSGCQNPLLRVKSATPEDPFSVGQCTSLPCTITVGMGYDQTGSRCTYTLPAYYVVPKSAPTITWTLSYPAGGATFQFPAGVVPVTVKGTGQRPWTAPTPDVAAQSYTVTRAPQTLAYATVYGLSLQVKPPGASDWTNCPPLDPMILNVD
jgi:hypothetical protein